MKIRECITRNITYSIVNVINGEEQYHYLVYGKTTEKGELQKLLKLSTNNIIPIVTVKTVTEKRAIDIENFVKHSILIEEGEDK